MQGGGLSHTSGNGGVRGLECIFHLRLDPLIGDPDVLKRHLEARMPHCLPYDVSLLMQGKSLQHSPFSDSVMRVRDYLRPFKIERNACVGLSFVSLTLTN